MNYNNYKILNILSLLILFVLAPNITYSATFSKTQAVDRNQNCTSGMFCRLIAYWTFDGSDIVNGVVKDMSATTTPSNGTMSNISTSTFYASGKLGQALNFDGVDDSVLIGVVPALHASTSDLTISAWIKPSKVTVGVLCIVCNSNSGGGIVPWALEFNSTAGRFSLGQVGAGSGTVRVLNSTTLKKDVWYHVVVVRTFVNTLNWPVTVYLNGVADGSGTIQRSGYAGQTIAIGKYGQINNNYFQGAIDDVRIYSRAMSANEVRQLYNTGASKFSSSRPITSTTTCTDSLSCGLVKYWSFNGDDIVNGVISDVSGGGNRGNLSGISSSTSYVQGKVGQAIYFDGVNDYARNVTTFDLTSTNIATVSFWANVRSFDSSNSLFFESSTNSNNNDGAIMFIPNSSNCSNGLEIGIQDSITTSKYRTECFNRPTTNAFHHYSVIFDNSTATGDVRLFIDGIEQSTQSTPNNNKDQSSNLGNYTWYLMSRAGSSLFNSGIIDEFYVHRRALSSSEILKLYNSGINKYATSPSVINTSSCSFGLNCGLLGYWTFDGKDTLNGFVRDASGNLKHGTLNNISTTTFYTSGKVGQAVNFDGVDDFVSAGNVSNSVKTVSFWVKSSDLNKKIIALDASTYSIEVISGVITANNFTSPTIYIDGSVGSTIKAGKWHHVTITTSSNVDVSQLYFGRIGSGYLSGSLDDVRLYNRAISAGEVRQLYSIGK